MKVSDLIAYLEPYKELDVKVVEAVSGDIADINNVSISHTNGGEVHIAIELEYED